MFNFDIYMTDLYDKAAASCKGYVEDSNYETNHRELGRGHRIKKKVQRLDSESDNESDSGSQDSTVKKARTRLTNKSLSKLKKITPAPPPVPFVATRKFVVSPHEIVRHTPQLEKQSPKKMNICKYSRNSNKNQVAKQILNMKKDMKKEKNENTMLSEKLRQLLSSKNLQKIKHPCIKAKRHVNIKMWTTMIYRMKFRILKKKMLLLKILLNQRLQRSQLFLNTAYSLQIPKFFCPTRLKRILFVIHQMS